MSQQPTEWHQRPANSEGPCSVCGFPKMFRGQHRRVDDPGALVQRYVKLVKSPTGYREVCVEVEPLATKADKPRVPIKRHRLPTGPNEKTRERIVAAVRLRLFEGKTNAEIADVFGITTECLQDYRRRYPGLWKAAEEELGSQVVKLVRSQVGTDAILNDVDLYLQRAGLADKWAKSRGRELFPVSDRPTLTSFYRSYYAPVCLSDAAESTKKLYEIVLRKWRLFTGDPALADVTNELLAKFRDALSKSRGLQACKRASPNTVAGNLRRIQTLLEKAGRPDRRNRDAAGILQEVPWVRPPRTEPRPVKVVEPEVINAVYTAALGMETPRIGHVKPSKWWRALLVLAFNTGLRRGTIFRLRWEWLLWEKRVFTIPGHSMKSRRIHVAPLNDTVLNHLRVIRADDWELVFPWLNCKRHFDYHWHRLLDLAGIPRQQHFGLHNLRKTLATNLWATSPAAAQLALSHTDSAITQGHYVEGSRIVAAAIDALPQPAAFIH